MAKYERDDAENLAKQLRGNWRNFESFGWHDQPEDADDWTIVYTTSRDAGLTAESNAAAIEKRLDPFIDSGDLRLEHHGHWACGWVDGYAIRVRDASGALTPAFLEWSAIQTELDNYPLLDESDYSEREYEAAIKAIKTEGRSLDETEGLAGDWPTRVFSWLWDNEQSEVENRDDQGAWPSRESIERALEALRVSS